MEPKRKSVAPAKKGKGASNNTPTRKHNRQKSKSKNNKGGGKPPISPFTIVEVVSEQDQLSINEKETLSQAVLDLKKLQQEEAQSNKREKQKRNEERKKMTNDTLKRKQEEEKKIKQEDEEKKRWLEKQKTETKKEVDELNYQLMVSKGGPAATAAMGSMNGGSIKRVNSTNDDKLLDSFKRKTLGRGLSTLFGFNSNSNNNSNQNNRSSSDLNSLRKYPSHSSLGLKSSGSLFRTISVPRVSKGQVSLQDLFDKQNSSSSLSTTISSSDTLKNPPLPQPRPLSHSSFKPSWYGTIGFAKHKDEIDKHQSVQNRWDEYVKTLLPSDLENIKQQRIKQKLQQEVEQQKQLDVEQQKSDDEKDKVEITEEQGVNKDDNKSTIENVQDGGEGVEIEKVVSPQQQEPTISTKAMTDGNMIISALKNKTTRSLREYKPAENEFATTSQRPPAMVNIFNYGTIHIDFAEVFGEVDDLKGFIMWTIGSFGIEERDYDDYPTFYSKDSYLVLNLSDNQLDSKMYNVHIWNGKETTLDRLGTSVMMALQLATHLGGKVNHYREEQGHESQLFLSYFFTEDYNGIKFKNGGNSSDFNIIPKVKPIGPTTLLKVDIPVIGLMSGRVNVRRVALSKKFVKSCNPDVAFVLENNQRIYIKFGPKSSIETKTLARSLAREYSNHYNNPIRIIEVVGEILEKEFFKYMSEQKTKEDRDKDYKTTEEEETIVNLYRTYIKDTGKLDLESVAEEYPIEFSELDHNEVFILDCTTDVFVWSPKGAPKKKVIAGRECGKMFFAEYERPQWASIHIIKQHHEHPLFKHQFKHWIDKSNPINFSIKIKPEVKKLNYDFNVIYNNIKDEVIEPVIENHSSDIVDVYSITLPDLQFFKVDVSEKGQFYENDCYMVIVSSRRDTAYNSLNANEPQTTIYWWEGVQADPKGYAAFVHGLYPIIAEKFVEMGQIEPRRCLIKQRKESNHFLGLFSNRIIIHKGSRFDEVDISDKIYNFLVEGQNTFIQQIDQNTTLLNSHHSYFVISPLNETIKIWKGLFSRTFTDELELFASYLDKDYSIKIVKQGKEDEKFWKSLPGLKREIVSVKNRLDVFYRFYFKNAEFTVERVNRLYPSDLEPQQCAMLDTTQATKSKIYVWFGENASDTLINISNIFVNDYCKNLSRKIDKVIKVNQYQEPLKFKLHFVAWDRKDVLVDPYELRQQQLAVQKTLDYRKQCEEEQALLREYLEYAGSLGDDDDLEDFESWVLAKKGAANNDPTTPPLDPTEKSKSKKPSPPPQKKNKKFLGLFKK